MTWANGYNYRVSIPIGPSDDGALTDHRATITIVQGAGTNAAGTIYLNRHALNWPNDIRFTSDAAGLVNLFFWRQESDATDGTWIVLIPSVAAAGNTTIYLWYGKTSDTDASNMMAVSLSSDGCDRIGAVLKPETSGWENGGQLRFGTVCKVDSTYYIFYTNGGASTSDIGRATSSDLVSWTKYASNPVLENQIAPNLLKELDGITPIVYDSKYWMLAVDAAGTGIQIYSASAIDGSWSLETNDAIVVGAAGTWRANAVLTCSFVKEGDTYYIFFQGADATTWRIGYATASSPAGPYTVAADPILAPALAFEGSAVVDPVVRKFGSTYYLFYTGNSGTSCYNSYATASTLTGTYTKSEILLCEQGESYPEIVTKDGLYYMFTDDLESGGTWIDLYVGPGFSTRLNRQRLGYAGTPTTSSSEILVNANGERVYSQYYTYKRLLTRVKFPSTLVNYHYFGWTNSASAGVTNSAIFFSYNTPDIKVWSGDASNYESTSIYDAAYKGAYHVYEIRWISGSAKFYVDGVLKATHTTYIPSTSLPAHFVDFGAAGNLYIDWIVVLDCPADFPEWQTPSSEQSASLLILPNRRTFKTLIVR